MHVLFENGDLQCFCRWSLGCETFVCLFDGNWGDHSGIVLYCLYICMIKTKHVKRVLFHNPVCHTFSYNGNTVLLQALIQPIMILKSSCDLFCIIKHKVGRTPDPGTWQFYIGDLMVIRRKIFLFLSLTETCDQYSGEGQL